jgi:UDP-glucose 4-epimerase
MYAATLRKAHIATHSQRAFIETNVSGTLNVLEDALANGASAVVFTSTTSAFGAALRRAAGEPAAWVTEDVRPVPRNIYGVTKVAAEDLCELFYRSKGLPSIVLRTSRFLPEIDDDPELRGRYDLNLKANEYVHRRRDVADAVDAHLLAAERTTAIGFGRYVVSATTPFGREHVARLRTDAAGVVRELFPDYEEEYGRRGWKMFPGSTASTTTAAPVKSSDGGHATTSAPSSTACGATRTRSAPPGASGARDIPRGASRTGPPVEPCT